MFYFEIGRTQTKRSAHSIVSDRTHTQPTNFRCEYENSLFAYMFPMYVPSIRYIILSRLVVSLWKAITRGNESSPMRYEQIHLVLWCAVLIARCVFYFFICSFWSQYSTLLIINGVVMCSYALHIINICK